MTRRFLIVFALLVLPFSLTGWNENEVCSAEKSGLLLLNADNYRVIEKGKKLRLKYSATGNAANRKIHYKSSNRRVATVSENGVVRTKKKGSVRITAYVLIKGKKKYKTSVKLRVGPRVKKIAVTGSKYVRTGAVSSLKATVYPKSAKVKKVCWSSANRDIAQVTSSGRVKGLKKGKTTITAKAVDGSKVIGRFIVEVYDFSIDDTLWVAHRGLHVSATENTAEAFRQAGQAQFWGCECDVRQTKDGELVINHDDSFARVFNVDQLVNEMTAEEIRNHDVLGSKVCFFEEYLDICYSYHMIPAVELKEQAMPEEAVKKAVKMVLETSIRNGGDEESGWSFLESTYWISFYDDSLSRLQGHIISEYGIDPQCTYLVSKRSQSEALKALDIAIANGFDGISVNKKYAFDNLIKKSKEEGLPVDLWSFKDTVSDNNLMYADMKKKGWDPAHITVDFKPFQ